MKIKEVIVVEGKKDTVKLKRAVDADTIETNGSAVNQTTLDMIQHAQEKRGVIIFTDPDYPGQRIRHIITQKVNGCKHAFLSKKDAVSLSPGRSVGIEHASCAAILEALKNVYETRNQEEDFQIEKKDLMEYGLIGGDGAKKRRQVLGELLHIGFTNGKQLLNRLYMFQITKDELNQAMQHIIEREDQNG